MLAWSSADRCLDRLCLKIYAKASKYHSTGIEANGLSCLLWRYFMEPVDYGARAWTTNSTSTCEGVLWRPSDEALSIKAAVGRKLERSPRL